MRYFAITLCGLFVLASFVIPKLKDIKINPNLTVSLPKNFVVMPDDAIAMKYPAPRKPLAAYTSPDGQIDFVASERTSTFQGADLAVLKEFYKASITSRYSEVKFIQEEIKTLNKRNFIVFEFTSSLRDEGRKTNKLAPIRKYTIIQYTMVNDKLMVFTFNAPIDLQEAWKVTANKIMQSIKISDPS
ncbi:hypothetical protein [Adhaeribacter aquaticus]|uniref:hypothetical protein n=1 Tax=Adhaeribacter aquaticus TaxID=299567 RepID=UPI00041395DC|nr:hypothetical protein [Adhaeribacter aquaticus]